MNIKKKSKRVPIALLMLAVALAMSLGGLTTAFADPPTYVTDGYLSGTQENPAEAAITKILKTPVGTTLPTLKYQFVFAPGTVDGASTETPPTISGDNKVEIEFTDTDKTVAGTLATSDGAIWTIPKESPSLFAGITWPHAGQYVYTVTESGILANTPTPETGWTETILFSKAKYEITVGVAEGTGGTLYIATISTECIIKDDLADEEPVVGSKEKVDPTPGSTTSEPDDYSDLIFTNTYVKTKTGVDPEEAVNSTLDVSKTVTGTYGSKTIYFPFDITVTTSAIASEVTSYNAYVVSGGAVVSLPDSNPNGAKGGHDDMYGDYISFIPGTSKTINLKHGQTLRFVGLPVGTSYYVNEQATPAYTPKATVTYNGGTDNTGGYVKEYGGQATDKNQAVETGVHLVGENANSAAYLNANNTTAPTGLDLNTLPFIGLIVLAVAGLVTYVVVRSRRRRRSGSY